MIFTSHANKTNFYKKGVHLGSFENKCFRISEVAYCTKTFEKK